MTTRAANDLALQNALRSALLLEELLLHYQPVIELTGGGIWAAEALLRWRHPERGLIPSDKFVPLAEETGQIVPIGMWVLRRACAQGRAWDLGGMPPIRVAVNLSARQFAEKNLVAGIHLRGIAEGVETREQLQFLRDEGCDFVQGYYYSRPQPDEQFARYLPTCAKPASSVP